MAVEVLYDGVNDRACLTCNTTDKAFGRVWRDIEHHSACYEAWEVAELFIYWLTEFTGVRDPRLLDEQGLGEYENTYLSWAEKSPSAYRKLHDQYHGIGDSDDEEE